MTFNTKALQLFRNRPQVFLQAATWEKFWNKLLSDKNKLKSFCIEREKYVELKRTSGGGRVSFRVSVESFVEERRGQKASSAKLDFWFLENYRQHFGEPRPDQISQYRWAGKIHDGVFLRACSWQPPQGAIRVKVTETNDFVNNTALDKNSQGCIENDDLTAGVYALETERSTSVDLVKFTDAVPCNMLSISSGCQPSTPLPLQDFHKTESTQPLFLFCDFNGEGKEEFERICDLVKSMLDGPVPKENVIKKLVKELKQVNTNSNNSKALTELLTAIQDLSHHGKVQRGTSSFPSEDFLAVLVRIQSIIRQVPDNWVHHGLNCHINQSVKKVTSNCDWDTACHKIIESMLAMLSQSSQQQYSVVFYEEKLLGSLLLSKSEDMKKNMRSWK